MQEKFSERLGTFAVIFFIFALMFWLNNLMPLHRDDYDYSLIWGTVEHINSLTDVFNSTWQHYFLHGGRFFTVFCLNLFLWLGKFPFDVANAAMFTALILLIYFHARREIKIGADFKILAVTGFFAWLSFPHFGEVAIWKSGSTVYLWSAVPAAIFLLPYNLSLAKRFSAGKFFAVGIFLRGLLAGCSVENLGVTVAILSAGISFYAAKKNFLQSWMPSGFFGSLIGLIILIAAPGNFVRYDVQGEGKGIFTHIGNQFAGNGEMFLYILPLVLILLCAYRLLKISAAKRRGIIFSAPSFIFPQKIKILLSVAVIFIISYLGGGVITGTISKFFTLKIFPLFNASQKFIDHFENFMVKSEEFIIYALIIFAIYFLLRNSLGFFGKSWETLNGRIGRNEILKTFPQIKFSLAMFALGFFNNFVMIAAPTFPARATFSSVIFFLVGAISILRLKEIREKFSEGSAGKIFKLGAILLGGFTIISALTITYELRQENDLRIARIEKAVAENREVVTFPQIELKNRALRHVFFVDFDNNVTKEGLCKFYGIKDIEISKQ